MINAVRIDHPGGQRWVTDPTSIAAYGRIEAVLQVSEALSNADLDRRGTAFLAGKKDPSISIESAPLTGPMAGIDFVTGDWVTVHGVKHRCVDVQYRGLDAVGNFQPPVPVFSSLPNERLLDADRAFDRLVRDQGGGWPDATPVVDRSIQPVGQLEQIERFSWSWYDGADSGSREILDDNSQWQIHEVRQPCRAALCTIIADHTGATGESKFELWKNGSNWNVLFDISIYASPPPLGFSGHWMWGYEFLKPGDKVSIRSVKNGQHRQGSYELFLFAAV